jgi:pSer/pThr/pTyr-binding forkhead associated (FHA) protein
MSTAQDWGLSVKILVFKDNKLLQSLELKTGESYTGGRKEDADIKLDKYPGISRQHFEIDEDGGGAWRVNVLSEVKFIEFQGEDRKDFQLKGKGEFLLSPYTFQFEAINETPSFDQASESEVAEQASFEAPLVTSDPSQEDSDDDYDSDEKTAVQNFSGLPYVKILGRDGKKSEYFRLEGNLWTIGGHESASVFIKDPAAAQNHFEISKTDKGFFVVDLGTPQGTELNGQSLTPKKPSRLLSGDMITVGSTTLQFELRDKAFDRKVSNIPLNMYKNPLVFFDQDVAMVSLDEENNETGQAEEIVDKQQSKEKRKKWMMIAAAVIVLLAVGQEFLMSSSEDTAKTTQADPFSQLSPAEQKIVVRTYKLASQLYLNRNYELSLVQLDKLHSILPVYKDSKKIEEDCLNARDIQRQKALREQQKREQELLQQRVHSAISQCEQQYAQSDDIDGVKACLAPAYDLDPNNPRIAQLTTDVTARSEERKIREKMAAEMADKVRRGKDLYDRARNLHRKQKWLEAIEAYENHIHSGLPDPKGLVKDSKRKLSSIEYKIKNQKTALISQAQSRYSGTQLKEAILLARQAQEVDPYDPKIAAFLFQIERELKNKMKAIYMDSVIEEKYGNLDASRTKWEQIIKADVKDGEYYIKAQRKLKQYGYKY